MVRGEIGNAPTIQMDMSRSEGKEIKCPRYLRKRRQIIRYEKECS